jgi:hypothetical protein
MAITKIIEVPSDLPHARVYLDDIEEIRRILYEALREEREQSDIRRLDREDATDEEAEPITASFQMEGHRFDSIEDLREYGGSTTEITLNVSYRYGNCEVAFRTLLAPRATLYSLKGDRKFATYAKVKAVLDRRALTLRNIVSQLPDWVTFALPYLIVPLAVGTIAAATSHRVLAMVLIFGTLGLVTYYCLRPSRVYFVQSHERTKNRSKQLRDYAEKLAFLIVGGLIGAWLSKLFGR